MKIFLALPLLSLTPLTSTAAEWIFNNKVVEIGVKYGNGCAKLENGEQIKFDLETAAGRAEFSVALSAKSTGSKLEVYKTDDPLVGGCDTGTTIRPHSMIRTVD